MSGLSAVVAIIQARMTSSRLPGKVLADIEGKTTLQRMIERTGQAKTVSSIVVATTTNTTDDPIAEAACELKTKVFRGDEADVLGRLAGAAREFNATVVVRLTADCPMIDPGIIDLAVMTFQKGDWDYVSNCNKRTYPDGLDVEVFSLDALKKADHEAEHLFLREHVTPYLRGSHPHYGAGNFSRGDIVFDADFSHVRWTLDTAEDLTRIRKLYRSLSDDHAWLDALSLATQNPELLGVPT